MIDKDYGILIRSITSNINMYIGERIEKYGINQGQFEYFLIIANKPGINQLDLARMKNVGKASVTKALKILEDDGFIRREISKEDRRNTLCYVTKQGEQIVNDLMLIKINAYEELFKGFSNEDRDKFYEYLALLYKNSQDLL